MLPFLAFMFFELLSFFYVLFYSVSSLFFRCCLNRKQMLLSNNIFFDIAIAYTYRPSQTNAHALARNSHNNTYFHATTTRHTWYHILYWITHNNITLVWLTCNYHLLIMFQHKNDMEVQNPVFYL
jgi:hypothetical protein